MKFVYSIMLMTLASGSQASTLSLEEMKLGCRQKIMQMAMRPAAFKSTFSPIGANDRAEDLIDDPRRMVRSLTQMEEMKLKSGRTRTQPWSDSYWPLYQGGLGQRYMDPEFQSYDWNEAKNYVSKRPVSQLMKDNRAELLSPSEKYDVLMGLKDLPLTAANWRDGGEFFRSHGKVESWMGYCHGWAPASFFMPEPKKKIVVTAASGPISFNPSDVKGLITLIWAKGRFNTRFIGGRCNSANPTVDRNGRAREQDCLDNNPGTWHLSVVNQIGISKRPFIMDASAAAEVWNHPVYSYEYSYFNLKTNKEERNLKDAMIAVGEWQDPRKAFRAAETRHLVGVRMTVTYAVENQPSAEENQQSLSSQVSYAYDLEINGQDEIIGGEWYSDSHPDFLWLPAPGTMPQTGEGNLNLDFAQLKPEVQAHASAHAKKGLPLMSVVKALTQRSHTR